MKINMGNELINIFDNWYNDDELSDTYFYDQLKKVIEKSNQEEMFHYIDDCLSKMLETTIPLEVSILVHYAHSFYVKLDTTQVTPLLQKESMNIKNHILLYGDNRTLLFLEFMQNRLKI
ncbi:hypothetical protein ACMGE6_10735 [Macrococcus equi]|uniref:hypothetical protein n=1 Tax=Macrococcus equi TaxID=3395462 RepID=UPI0039BE2B91